MRDHLCTRKRKVLFGNKQWSFDITVGPLVKLWGIWTDNPQVPNKNEINDLLDKINYKDILIEQNPRAMLKGRDRLWIWVESQRAMQPMGHKDI